MTTQKTIEFTYDLPGGMPIVAQVEVSGDSARVLRAFGPNGYPIDTEALWIKQRGSRPAGTGVGAAAGSARAPGDAVMTAALDLRSRCARQRCDKLIRKGQQAQAEFKRYSPFCSYHCQEWARLEGAQAVIDRFNRSYRSPA